MDHHRFDDLASQLDSGISRRRGLSVLAALGLSAGVLADDAEAKKHKHKKKKVVRNGFGCVNVGRFCQSGDQCCSGMCAGKQGRKACQAHDQSTCTGQNVCTAASPPLCTTSTGLEGTCAVTTGNASYCQATSGGRCAACQRDADCVSRCGAGAACISCPSCAMTGVGSLTACVSLTVAGCSASA